MFRFIFVLFVINFVFFFVFFSISLRYENYTKRKIGKNEHSTKIMARTQTLCGVKESRWATPGQIANDFLMTYNIIPFSRIYKEIYQLGVENNNLQSMKKLLLKEQDIKTQCVIEQCTNINKYQTLSLCYQHRLKLANEFCNTVTQQVYAGSVPKAVGKTVINLKLGNDEFIAKSHHFAPIDENNYFNNICANLLWQKEIIDTLLSTNKGSDNNNEFLTLVNRYLNEIRQLLILFYCYFDWTHVIVFYPWICKAIGNNASKSIFFDYVNNDSDDMKELEVENDDSIGVLAYNWVNARQVNNENIEKLKLDSSLLSVSILKECIYDLIKSSNQLNGKINPLSYLRDVESQLNQMITKVKYDLTAVKAAQQMFKSTSVDSGKQVARYLMHPEDLDGIMQLEGLDEGDGDDDNDLDNIIGGQMGRHTVTLVSGGDKQEKFQLSRKDATLSILVNSVMQTDTQTKEIDLPQIPANVLKDIVKYLQHHNGKVPQEIPCPVRSINMHQIVDDPWDAEFIDSFEKTEIFEIILAANYMDIHPLLHLGCAKIATLIKQLDQKEINKIIEEEEKYRRENPEKEDSIANNNTEINVNVDKEKNEPNHASDDQEGQNINQ